MHHFCCTIQLGNYTFSFQDNGRKLTPVPDLDTNVFGIKFKLPLTPGMTEYIQSVKDMPEVQFREEMAKGNCKFLCK